MINWGEEGAMQQWQALRLSAADSALIIEWNQLIGTATASWKWNEIGHLLHTFQDIFLFRKIKEKHKHKSSLANHSLSCIFKSCDPSDPYQQKMLQNAPAGRDHWILTFQTCSITSKIFSCFHEHKTAFMRLSNGQSWTWQIFTWKRYAKA